MSISERIRAARDAKGWTQAELAERMGLSPDFGPMQVSHWENAHKEPSVGSLARIAASLGVTMDHLVHGEMGR